MKKSKLPTFICNNAQLKIHVNNQYLTLKEEQKLMSRFVIAARCRPDIDLPGCFGMCKFPVLSKSLFTPDGNLHKCTDKANVADEIYNLQASVMLNDAILNGDSNEQSKVIIFDGMAIVNLIDTKKQKIKTCLEFAHAFVNIIIKESQGFSEVRVIFDRYVASSLKSYTGTTRRTGDPIQYKIHGKSKIGHLETKEFLANKETKNDLTQYLAEKLVTALATVAYAIVFGNTCETNIDINENLFSYNQEKADTGIVLYALDVTQRIRFLSLSSLFPIKMFTYITALL